MKKKVSQKSKDHDKFILKVSSLVSKMLKSYEKKLIKKMEK